MKRIWNLLFFAFFIFCMFLFKPRQDLVLAAIDESQYIRLFEEGKDFVICVEENKIFTGTYSFSRDTVFLDYKEPTAYNEMPPGKLYINNSAKKIKSIDGKSFSAEIYMDIRDKSSWNPSLEEWNLANHLRVTRANLSLSETAKEASSY
jgi:hypothetical protein